MRRLKVFMSPAILVVWLMEPHSGAFSVMCTVCTVSGRQGRQNRVTVTAENENNAKRDLKM
jgi:hypothetical protein